MSTLFIYDNSVAQKISKNFKISQKFSKTRADEVFRIIAGKATENSVMVLPDIFSRGFGKTNACVKLSQRGCCINY